jgi:hypothetical protein
MSFFRFERLLAYPPQNSRCRPRVSWFFYGLHPRHARYVLAMALLSGLLAL